MEFTSAGPSTAEQDIAKHLKEGELFGPDTESTRDWPVIHAGVIRNILGGTHKDVAPGAERLHMRHVRIEGRINLDHIDTRVSLELDQCDLPEGISAVRARLSGLSLRQITINRPTTEEAVFNFENLHAHHIDLTGTKIINSQGPALSADNSTVISTVRLNQFTAQCNHHKGTVSLMAATIGGQLILEGAHLANTNGPALVASVASIAADVHFNNVFKAESTGHQGTIMLPGARIGGMLDMEGARLTNKDGPALYADYLTVESHAVLQMGFKAEGEGQGGSVRLIGATIGGQLLLRYAELINKTGPALLAGNLSVGSHASLDWRLIVEGSGAGGAVNLEGANFGRGLSFSGAHLTNKTGPALRAPQLTTISDVSLNYDFTAEGEGAYGAVELTGATVGGRLNITKAQLINETGPALVAEHLTVKQSTFIDLTSTDSGTVASDGVQEPEEKTARGRGSAVIKLAGSYLGITLDVSEQTLRMATESDGWDIAGVTYNALSATTSDNWLHFIQFSTSHYSPQPYQQFATVTRAYGDENLVREILITQRNHQLDHGHLTLRHKMQLRLLRITVGYGFQTWRAIVWLAVLAVAAAMVTYGFGGTVLSGLHQPADSRVGPPGGPCRGIDLFTLSLQVIPLIPLTPVTTSNCVPMDTAGGFVYITLSIVLKVLAWALVTLFIAGYTNIVRKPGP